MMGHPEALKPHSLHVCSSKSDHTEATSKNKNGSTTVKFIDFSHTSISIFPELESSHSTVFHHITSLYLNHNKLKTVPSGLHNVLPNLQVFNLDENELSELPEDVYKLKFLQEIYVCNNKLISVPHSMYKLKQLRILNLSSNELKSLHPEIGQNENLVELYLSGNVLKRFPATFGLLVNLQVLDAGNNQLERIPQTVKFLTNLQEVNLKHNRLSAIPDSFSELKNLKHVNLAENRISTLWQTCVSVQSLETIVLDSNLINILPSWFSQLVNVCEICVAKNNLRNIDSFPLDFGKRLQRLKKLDLRGNFMEKLPPSLNSLSSLETLLLGAAFENENGDGRVCENANWIAALPSNFIDLKHLVFLTAEENQLVNLPKDFGCLALLKDLRLGGNLIISLPNSFCKLESLERCQLSKNRLRSLPEDFGRLDKLKELYLDFNKLKSVPVSMKNCVQLEVLDLRGNKLTEAPPGIVNVLTGLKDLKVSRPPPKDESESIGDAADFEDDMDNDDDDFPSPWCEEYSDDDPDSRASSSGSSTHLPPLVKADEENWDDDLNTCQSANAKSIDNSTERDSGQFELDGDEDRLPYKSSGTTFDVYGNPSQRIDLDITQHRMLPYLLHRPRNVWGLRELAPGEVEEQYNDAV